MGYVVKYTNPKDGSWLYVSFDYKNDALDFIDHKRRAGWSTYLFVYDKNH